MVKMTLSGGQILTLNFDFRGHISTFQAETSTKNEPFKTKNNAQTTSEQLQTNFQKLLKTGFLTLKIVQTRNFNFRGHISTFRAKNTPKSVAFKAKNNA